MYDIVCILQCMTQCVYYTTTAEKESSECSCTLLYSSSMVQHSVLPKLTVQNSNGSTVLYNIVQYSTIQYSTVLNCAVQICRCGPKAQCIWLCYDGWMERWRHGDTVECSVGCPAKCVIVIFLKPFGPQFQGSVLQKQGQSNQCRTHRVKFEE